MPDEEQCTLDTPTSRMQSDLAGSTCHMVTAYHARYFAHELTRRHAADGVDRLSMALFDACVDLNPHQIEAALFAMRSPLSAGVLLADEVGLGKTIEAGLVLCQYWAERRRRLLVICPASLRKQWSLELEDKLNLPTEIVDARSYRKALQAGAIDPLHVPGVLIMSYNYAMRLQAELRAAAWDLVVIDEAHKLRNAYRPSNRMGQALAWALESRRKVLLTATPLQNSLLELYGLASVLDEHIFGDQNSFRAQYSSAKGDLDALRERLRPFCWRSLRRQVQEYIQYTERRPLTVRFRPSDDEHKLYEAVSAYLSRDEILALPRRQRHLTSMIVRKLLASSSFAIAGTMDKMQSRLNRQLEPEEEQLLEELVEDEEIEDEYLEDDEPQESPPEQEPLPDPAALRAEANELLEFAQWARRIGVDTKSRALLQALQTGFDHMAAMGASRRALIFTESRRTQEYLREFLSANGYAGQLVLFNGTNADPESRRIVDEWMEANRATGRSTGSRPVDSRTALVEYFRDSATIMVATEAAAEGVNLQFCSLVVNYDLPWNPQRIEQRIGRCHRYGQQHDVVVVNFLNERNEVDRRVFELLDQKFSLFSGLFGASDEVLGTVESGLDFEKRIHAIYQQCRTTDEIEAAFHELQAEMDEAISTRLDDTRRILLEHFDEDVHARLRMRLSDAQSSLDRVGRMFWALTRYCLDGAAEFHDDRLTFDLRRSPVEGARPGRYHLITKTDAAVPSEFLYRLSHPLGEWALTRGRQADTPIAEVTFDVSGYPRRLSMVEELEGKRGWLTLRALRIDSYEREEHLLFSATTDDGRSLDAETCERLFLCDATVGPTSGLAGPIADRMGAEAETRLRATMARSLERNSQLFNEEREKLEKWADDMVLAAEKELRDTKEQIKSVRRQARVAETLDEQDKLQRTLKDLEKKQRRQRQAIFDAEDDIAEKRDQLIEGLQRRMQQRTEVEDLFTIRWTVL